MEVLNRIVDDIKHGYGWASIQYISNTCNFLSHADFACLISLLMYEGLLVNENLLSGGESGIDEIPYHAFVKPENLVKTLYPVS